MHYIKLNELIFLITLFIFVNSYNHGHHHHHSLPFYKFNYGVKDPHTGDIKQQWETRDGDKVNGAYELNDADGTKRIVEYMADKHNGFNAIVKKIGQAGHYAHAPKLYGHHRHGHHGYRGPAVSYSNVYLHH